MQYWIARADAGSIEPVLLRTMLIEETFELVREREGRHPPASVSASVHWARGVRAVGVASNSAIAPSYYTTPKKDKDKEEWKLLMRYCKGSFGAANTENALQSKTRN